MRGIGLGIGIGIGVGLALGLGLGCGASKPRVLPTAAPATARTLHFRRTSTGLVRSTTTRETWTLELDDRGTILRGVLERGAPSTLTSLDAVAWETVGEVSYASAKRIDASTARAEYRLEKFGGGEDLVLSCAHEWVRVRLAGATLVHGDACGGGGPEPHWEPAGTTKTDVLRCEVPSKGEPDVEGGRSFDFADGAGVEWVYEDSDCSAQEGSLRAMK